ncbi:MAG TPA: hypothetical protein PKY28_06640 [Ferruginibacter sp.]|nr:hypothetical protein [Ferruginibacter sp.]
MQYRKCLIIFCCVFLSTAQLFAQSASDADITGLWKGTMYNDTTKQFLKYEIAISENKGKFSGYSHTYFILEDKEYHGVKKVRIKKKDGKIIVEDLDLIANNYPVPPAKGVRQLDVLTLEIKDGIMTLSGPFSTNRTRQYSSLTGTINVQRKDDFRQSALVPHLEELQLANNLSFVQEEKIKEEKAIVKTEKITEPVVVKTAPVVKEKPAEEKAVKEPEIVKTAPVVKEKPVEEKIIKKPEPAPVKKQPVTEQPVAKTIPVVKEKPAEEKIIKKPEPAIAKPQTITEQPVVKTVPVVKESETTVVKTVDPLIKKSAIDADKRTVETIQSVYYKSDSLVLTLYDNGEVDGDTVSVLMNGKVVMPMVGLSTNAVRKTIYTKDVAEDIQLVMYAETLGSLPPNTGLLIVYDGTDRYEIRFSGDMKKSSAIMFKRKE